MAMGKTRNNQIEFEESFMFVWRDPVKNSIWAGERRNSGWGIQFKGNEMDSSNFTLEMNNE